MLHGLLEQLFDANTEDALRVRAGEKIVTHVRYWMKRIEDGSKERAHAELIERLRRLPRGGGIA